MLTPLAVWITINCRKFLKRWENQTTLPASWETSMHFKKQQLESDMEQWTGSKLGKKYCYFAYLTYMHSTSCKIVGWMTHKLESKFLGEISTTSVVARWYYSNGRKWRGTKELLDEDERGEWKSWLKIHKTKIMASGPITSWQRDGKIQNQW